jgi:hypothetical protein
MKIGKSNFLKRCHLIALASILTTGPAFAASIAIVNHSFEAAGLADNDATLDTPFGWSKTGVSGIFDPGASFFLSTSALNSNPITAGNLGDMHGTDAVFSNGAAEFQQTLGTTMVLGWEYTLTVAVGYRDVGAFDFGGYRLELLAGGNVVATTGNVATTPLGTFTDASLIYTAQAGDSGALGIRLINLGNGANGQITDFDNVRLDAVPEPSSAILAGLAALPLVLRRRK